MIAGEHVLVPHRAGRAVKVVSREAVAVVDAADELLAVAGVRREALLAAGAVAGRGRLSAVATPGLSWLSGLSRLPTVLGLHHVLSVVGLVGPVVATVTAVRLVRSVVAAVGLVRSVIAVVAALRGLRVVALALDRGRVVAGEQRLVPHRARAASKLVFCEAALAVVHAAQELGAVARGGLEALAVAATLSTLSWLVS